MHKTAREAIDFIEKLGPLLEGDEVKIFLAVPYTSISPAAHAAKNTRIVIGAQNMHEAREGAFTGEIASLMLKEAGASFVLIGHSERRALFGESEERIQKKMARALADDLTPVLCIGESLEDRRAKKMEKVLKEQLSSALHGLPNEDAGKIILAYEPVWAIGSGESATPKMAQEAHAFIRAELTHLLGARAAGHIPILYGGSVNPENAHSLMAQGDVDGLLVGGASLKPESFAAIIKNATEKKS
jgi:triosephosphate isomerase